MKVRVGVRDTGDHTRNASELGDEIFTRTASFHLPSKS
jgi:hypothetical protein